MKKITVLLFAFIAFGCSNDDDKKSIVCTQEVRPALVVTVTDAVSGALLSEGVTVLAVSGATSLNVPSEGRFISMGIPGNPYIVKVTKAGYADYTSTSQTSPFGECGYTTNNLSVLLQPLQD
ncbi:peptidase associated/transthyretin-like domain-containing protein [Flavobacterium hauense]